jgi:hypothetical protein
MPAAGGLTAVREIATIIQEILFRPAICLTVHIWPERAEVWPVSANLQARKRGSPATHPSNPATQPPSYR